MYATIRNHVGKQGFADELVKRQDDVKRIIQGIPGFQAYYLIRTEEGVAVSVSVFEDRAGAEESTRQAGEWVQTNLPDMAATPPEVSSGEVVIQL